MILPLSAWGLLSKVPKQNYKGLDPMSWQYHTNVKRKWFIIWNKKLWLFFPESWFSINKIDITFGIRTSSENWYWRCHFLGFVGVQIHKFCFIKNWNTKYKRGQKVEVASRLKFHKRNHIFHTHTWSVKFLHRCFRNRVFKTMCQKLIVSLVSCPWYTNHVEKSFSFSPFW